MKEQVFKEAVAAAIDFYEEYQTFHTDDKREIDAPRFIVLVNRAISWGKLSGMISLEDAHTAVDAVKKLNQLKRVI